MYSFIFGLLSLSFLLFYGMIHTISFARKMKQELELKSTYIRYGSTMGVYGCICLFFGLLLYYYGVG